MRTVTLLGIKDQQTLHMGRRFSSSRTSTALVCCAANSGIQIHQRHFPESPYQLLKPVGFRTLIMNNSANTAPTAAAPSSASTWLSGMSRALSSTGAAIIRLRPHTTCGTSVEIGPATPPEAVHGHHHYFSGIRRGSCCNSLVHEQSSRNTGKAHPSQRVEYGVQPAPNKRVEQQVHGPRCHGARCVRDQSRAVCERHRCTASTPGQCLAGVSCTCLVRRVRHLRLCSGYVHVTFK